MPNSNEHNYMKKLRRLFQERKLPKVGLELVEVYHDDWCAIYSGRYCNCDPDIRLRDLVFRNPEQN
jgi:hypothetical protein